MAKKTIGKFDISIEGSGVRIDDREKNYSNFYFDVKHAKKIFIAINKALSKNDSFDLNIGKDTIAIICDNKNNKVSIGYSGSKYDDEFAEIPIKDMRSIMKFVLGIIEKKQTSEGTMAKSHSMFSEGFDQVEEFFKQTTKAPVKATKEMVAEQAEVLTAFECAMTDMRDMVSQNPAVVSQNATAMNGILQRLYDIIREIEVIKSNV